MSPNEKPIEQDRNRLLSSITRTPAIGHDVPEMNQNEETGTGGGAAHYRWWAAASTGQLVWGIYALRRGYAGECRMMPLKAFAVASLFVGATASASMASIRAYGIHSVEDMKVVGASIRAGLGLTRTIQQQQQPSIISQVGSGDDRVYADLTPTMGGKEADTKDAR